MALGRLSILVAVVAAGLLAVGAGAAAAGVPGSLSLEPPEVPVKYGKAAVLTGTVDPAAEGIEIIVAPSDGSGEPLGRATTNAEGRFTVTVEPAPTGFVRASAPSIGLSSRRVAVDVRPVVTASVRKAHAFTDARLTIRTKPVSASGVASVIVKRNARVVETGRVRVENGLATTTVAAPGPGTYTVVVEFDPRGRLVVGRASAVGKTSVRFLAVGSKGVEVAGLLRRLRQLRIHVPRETRTFSSEVSDAVLAFQKVAGLPRTGVMSGPDWKRLATTRPVEATRKGPRNRIEIDKTRQILIKVRHGEVIGTLHVSTGRTGNTPEGVHAIRWKAPTSTTWLGPGILYRTLTFVGNSFAIHGWPDVPAYPASSGCVRVPMWAADWLYNRSPVGESVIVGA